MTPQPPMPLPPPSPPPARFHAGGLVNGAVVLGLLYFGREVLVPITLAVLLSLLIAPLVRKLRRLVRAQVPAVLGAVNQYWQAKPATEAEVEAMVRQQQPDTGDDGNPPRQRSGHWVH